MLAAGGECQEATHTLYKVKDLRGERIAARDGDVGRVDQVYFDDEDCQVRYLVVDTAGWLSSVNNQLTVETSR